MKYIQFIFGTGFKEETNSAYICFKNNVGPYYLHAVAEKLMISNAEKYFNTTHCTIKKQDYKTEELYLEAVDHISYNYFNQIWYDIKEISKEEWKRGKNENE